MPLYEFSCEECDKIRTVFCKMGEDKKVCPKCKTPMKKLMSTANWSLKGSGWYRTTNPN